MLPAFHRLMRAMFDDIFNKRNKQKRWYLQLLHLFLNAQAACGICFRFFARQEMNAHCQDQ